MMGTANAQDAKSGRASQPSLFIERITRSVPHPHSCSPHPGGIDCSSVATTFGGTVGIPLTDCTSPSPVWRSEDVDPGSSALWNIPRIVRLTETWNCSPDDLLSHAKYSTRSTSFRGHHPLSHASARTDKYCSRISLMSISVDRVQMTDYGRRICHLLKDSGSYKHVTCS